ncbi:MAG: sulfatase [Pirellulales bacterium]
MFVARWLAIAALIACWMGAHASATAAPAKNATAKNVVLIVADDLGRTLGCYGDTTARTPNLDRLAAEGTLFTHAFCTTASCSASRSVILSGMYNHATGQYGLQHAEHHFSSFDRVVSLPARLSKAGYRTARIGKFHVAPEAVYPFDEALPGNPRNGVQMANNCRAFLTADDKRPFFLYFCTTDPHRGGGVGPAPLRPNVFGNEGNHPHITPEQFDPAKVTVPACLPDTEVSRAELAQYYQSANRLDQGVGRLVQVLKDSGHWDDTLVIFISDNGIAFPGAKTTTYEPGLRLPCLVRHPQAKSRGVQSSALVNWTDIAPTVLEFAGASATGPGLHGRSLLSVLEQADPPGFDETYASHTFHEITMYYPMRVVRTRQFKLIWNLAHPLPYPSASDLYKSATWQEALAKGPDSPYGKRTVGRYLHRPEFELYDLTADPDETTNLAGESAHAATLDALKARLRAFQERTSDPWISKWEYE